MKAYYFAANDKKLRHGDNRKIRVGITHKIKGTPVLCEHGLHASERLIDALKYAPGHMLYVVQLGGEIVKGEDKVVAQERTYVSFLNAKELLREFARKQALINIKKIKPYTTEEDYAIIIKWLKTGDKKYQIAARSAAAAAAWSAADSAAESAAESAAHSAARSAADSAARLAARSAADKMLTKMVKEATGWMI